MKQIWSRLKEYFQQLANVAKQKYDVLTKTLNSIRPKWLGGAGLWDFLEFFYDALTDRKFTLAAMGMAYRFFFAVFPGLILIFTLIPYIPVDNLQNEVNSLLSTVVPSDSLGFLELVVQEFFDKPNPSVIYINVGLLLYASMSGIRVMLFAFTKDSALYRRRNVFRIYAVAFLILIVLFVLFLFMIALVATGEYLIYYLENYGLISKGWVPAVLYTLEVLILLFGLEIGFSVLYYLGPETEERWHFFSVGSMAAGIMMVLAIFAFRWFFENFANYNKIYGSIGAVMGLMVWFYWMSSVLLVGFELNAAIAEAKFRFGLRRTADPDDFWFNEGGEEGEWSAGTPRNQHQ